MPRQIIGLRFSLLILLTLTLVSCAEDMAIRQKKTMIHLRLSDTYLSEGNLPAALREALAAYDLDREDPTVHNVLGCVYVRRGEVEKAIEHFNQAVKIKPDFSEAYDNLGTIYLTLEDWDKAIQQFNLALSNPLYLTPQFA